MYATYTIYTISTTYPRYPILPYSIYHVDLIGASESFRADRQVAPAGPGRPEAAELAGGEAS